MIVDSYIAPLLRCGAATWKTWSIGGACIGTIPVSQGSYAILRQIIWNPPLDYRTFEDVYDVYKRLHYQVALCQRGQNEDTLLYHFRSPIVPINDGEGNPLIGQPSPPVIVETWGLFNDFIDIDIIVVPSPDTWSAVNTSFTTSETRERAAGLGFGDGANIDGGQQIIVAGSESYLASSQFRPTTIAPTTGHRDNYRFAVTKSRQPNQPKNCALLSMGYVLCTFGYFEISKAKEREFLSGKDCHE